MSWFSRFFTPAAPAPARSVPVPAPSRPPAPIPAPPPLTPRPNQASVAPSPARSAPPSPSARPEAGTQAQPQAGALVVRPPWFPNEGPALEAAANSANRTISELDAVLADLHHTFASVDWFGPDAEEFRARWRNEQAAITGSRANLRNLEASLRQRGIDEATRFRMQESS
jgi:hypothetical protein